MDRKEQIKQEIAQKKAELERLEMEELDGEKFKAIKSLNEFTIEEKIEAFDSLYNMAESMFISESDDSDDEHYSWEAIMELLARNRSLFWKYYNKLNK